MPMGVDRVCKKANEGNKSNGKSIKSKQEFIKRIHSFLKTRKRKQKEARKRTDVNVNRREEKRERQRD